MKELIEKQKEKFSINKTSVELYKIRHESGFCWADITIDANGTTGRISIASDYGSWQYYWGACGESFKKFLCGLDKSYIAGKFGADKWFDSEKTVAEYRRVIKENINDGYISKKKGIEALAELQCLEESSCKEEFCRHLEDCSEIMRLYDHCPSLVYDIEPSFENFWIKLWPILIEQLQSESTLQSEQPTVSKKESVEQIEHETCDGCQMLQECGCMLDDSCPECFEHSQWISREQYVKRIDNSFIEISHYYDIAIDDIKAAINIYINGKPKQSQPEISAEEIYKWLNSKTYQTEYNQDNEYRMYFSVDMPKILNDFLHEYAKQFQSKESLQPEKVSELSDEEIVKLIDAICDFNTTEEYTMAIEEVRRWLRDRKPSIPTREMPTNEIQNMEGVIASIQQIIEDTEELNMVNYNHDQVKSLNEAIIEIYTIVHQFKSRTSSSEEEK